MIRLSRDELLSADAERGNGCQRRQRCDTHIQASAATGTAAAGQASSADSRMLMIGAACIDQIVSCHAVLNES